MGERLTSAIAAFYADDTGATRLELLGALAESELLVPAAERTHAKSPLRLAFGLDSKGQPFLPGFTDTVSLKAWLPSGSPYAKASGDVIGRTLLAGPFVALLINPGSNSSVRVDRGAFEMLLRSNRRQLSEISGPLVQRWPQHLPGS